MKLPTTHDFSKFSTADLHAKLARALEATAGGLYEAAEIWNELNRRGEAPRMPGILKWLPSIARGELAAETVVAFAGHASLIQGMVGMSLDDQRKYAAGDSVTVATFDENDKPISEEKPLASLSAREVKLVVDRGQIRPLKQQINSLKRSRVEAKTKPTYSTVTIQSDVVGGVLIIGHARVRPSDLASHLRRLGYRLERIDDDRRSADAEARPGA